MIHQKGADLDKYGTVRYRIYRSDRGVAAAVHLAQPTTHPQQVLPLRELEDAHQCRVSLHKQGHNLQVAF